MLLLILTCLVGLYVLYVKRKHSYWKRRGLEYAEPEFFFGNNKQFVLQRHALRDHVLRFYNQFKKRGLKIAGMYSFLKPTCMILDPDLIKHITIKDFSNFHNRGTFVNEKNDPLTGSLLNLENDKWKTLRSKLTPTFTSGKMKMMFETFVNCTNGLEIIMTNYAKNNVEVDIKDVLGRFTTDIIGSCAFGLECNSMTNPDSEFRKYGKRVFEPKNLREKLNPFLIQVLPKSILNLIGFKFVKPDVEEFFLKIVRDTVNYRENENVYRKDFMHLLIQLKNMGEVNDGKNLMSTDGKKREIGLTLNELSAQAYVFFLAGFETSSTAMTFALYELAINPDIQEKLRNEIRTVLKKHENKLTYDGIMEMTYLQKVLDETLRKYPPVPSLPRLCTAPYKIPGTSVTIEPGTRMMIPVIGIHHDPDYYPNPELFDPERFNEENKAARPACTFLPFGEGPRNCIGLRFGLLQSKVGLAAIIKDFKISLNNKTHVPLQYDNKSFIQAVKDGVWLNVSKIE